MPPTECIYQVSNWYLKACWRKVRKTRTDGRTDGQTDGRTLPRHNTSRFSNGRTKKIWVDIGSDNSLLPDGTKPIPEPMLITHQWSLVTFTWGKFHGIYAQDIYSLDTNLKIINLYLEPYSLRSMSWIISPLNKMTDNNFKCNSMAVNSLGLWLMRSHHWFRWCLGIEKVTRHYLNQWWPRWGWCDYHK